MNDKIVLMTYLAAYAAVCAYMLSVGHYQTIPDVIMFAAAPLVARPAIWLVLVGVLVIIRRWGPTARGLCLITSGNRLPAGLLAMLLPGADRTRSVMSHPQTGATIAIGTAPIHVPVLHTGTEVQPAKADTNAENTGTWELPRVSSKLDINELITLLAAQRGQDSKYRFSANKIHDLVGGARGDVLARVKLLREPGPPPVYPPRTPEQESARADLNLP